MRTILIPTDFSPCALNACKYAVELAEITKSKLVFYNSYFYTTPLARPEAYFDTLQLENVKEEADRQLNDLVKTLLLKEKDIEFELDHSMSIGNISGEINAAVEKYRASLIVMGTHGVSGTIQKVFIGSNAATMVAESKIPVIVVPEKSKFNVFKKITFATTLEEINDVKLLEPLSELSWLIEPEINFLIVVKSADELPTDEQLEQYMKYHGLFDHVNHRLYTVVDPDVLNGINNFILETNPDLMVTIPKKHGLIGQFFHTSISKELVYEALVPILCLK